MLLQISLELLHINGYDVLTLGILGPPLLDGGGAFYFPLAPWLRGFVGTHLYVVGGQLLVQLVILLPRQILIVILSLPWKVGLCSQFFKCARPDLYALTINDMLPISRH